MKIKIYHFDKFKNPSCDDLRLYYTKLLGRYADITWVRLKDMAELKVSVQTLEKVFEEKGRVILLSEQGQTFSTLKFKGWLEKQKDASHVLHFVCGNAFGFEPEVYKKAHAVLSLSELTFPHELAAVLLVEQLYRGFNLMAGGKYHKE